MVGGDGTLGSNCQSAIPYARLDVAGRPSAGRQCSHPDHALLGSLVSGADLAQTHAPAGAGHGRDGSHGNRPFDGDDGVWACHAGGEHGIYAGECLPKAALFAG